MMNPPEDRVHSDQDPEDHTNDLPPEGRFANKEEFEIPRPVSQIVYYDFEGYVAGHNDNRMIKQHTAEELFTALLDYRQETNTKLNKAIAVPNQEPNKAVVKAMEVRLKQLREEESNSRKRKQQWALVIAGLILTVVLPLLIYHFL